MLKNRLHLKFHHEMRPFEGYELTIAKSGLKIKESANPDAPQAPAGVANKNMSTTIFPRWNRIHVFILDEDIQRTDVLDGQKSASRSAD